MIDLSKYPCPWCGNTNGNATDDGYAACSECGRGVLGDAPTDNSAAADWIELSEKVHGKLHDGKTVDVRIAVVVGQHGEWDASKIMSHDGAAEFNEMSRWIYGMREHHIVTATLPLPVAQEVKGRVGE